MKKIFSIVIFIIVSIIFAACSYERGLILFNSVPIIQSNALHDQKVFINGTKIYYLFIAPKKMHNDFIRVQVFKMTDTAALGGNDIVRTKDFRLMKDERYYYTDYFTFYEKGRYVMQIFSHEDFKNPIGVNDFYVK